jgi:hypothetical protein
MHFSKITKQICNLRRDCPYLKPRVSFPDLKQGLWQGRATVKSKYTKSIPPLKGCGNISYHVN